MRSSSRSTDGCSCMRCRQQPGRALQALPRPSPPGQLQAAAGGCCQMLCLARSCCAHKQPGAAGRAARQLQQHPTAQAAAHAREQASRRAAPRPCSRDRAATPRGREPPQRCSAMLVACDGKRCQQRAATPPLSRFGGCVLGPAGAVARTRRRGRRGIPGDCPRPRRGHTQFTIQDPLASPWLPSPGCRLLATHSLLHPG